MIREPTTDPEPVPALFTVSVRCAGPVLLKLAVTVLLEFMFIVHWGPATLSQLVQPANVEPVSATACSVTGVPSLYASVQSPPQLIPVPVTVPVPVPPLATVSVR